MFVMGAVSRSQPSKFYSVFPSQGHVGTCLLYMAMPVLFFLSSHAGECLKQKAPCSLNYMAQPTQPPSPFLFQIFR